MLTWIVLVAVSTTYVEITGAADCHAFALAKYYSSHMVLQRAPVRPRIWGYTRNIGNEVVVKLGRIETVTATAVMGQAGRPIWEAVFQPINGTGPYQITVTQSVGNCVIELVDVLVGDVWICGGQSNMGFPMKKIDNPKPDILDAPNYPNVRTFYNRMVMSKQPLEDLRSVVHQWQPPTAAIIRNFSAVCWLYGRNLWRKLQRPIGLIETNWSGSRIEAWSSPDALKICFASGTSPTKFPFNAASALWNAMIHPFIPMPIYGAIWYQGEQNEANPNKYGCALHAMVNDWREKWFEKTPTMDAVFPFGEVQLAPWRNTDIVRGYADVRWEQTNRYGYTPNADLSRIFMAVAVDLPDDSSQHPRYKRQIADRLSLAAFNVAYGITDVGIYQGPIPNEVDLGTTIVRFEYGLSVEIRHYKSWSGFELCCSTLTTDPTCSGQSSWSLTDIVGYGSTYVDLSNVCLNGDRPNVVGFRYLWRESPCALEACAVYSVENKLPAPPYRAFFGESTV